MASFTLEQTGRDVNSPPQRIRLTVVQCHVEDGPVPKRQRDRKAWFSLSSRIRRTWSETYFPARSQPGAWSRKTSAAVLLLGLVAGLLFFLDLNHPLLDPDEGRQAEVPREMLAHRDLLVPRFLGQPYYDKPPLQYWLTACAYTLFGVHPTVARLVPAAAALVTVLVTFLWGRWALGERAGFFGALVLCLTPGFVIVGRTVVLDSLLTACIMASWSTLSLAVAGQALARRWWVLSALAAGLGILTKGPVTLVLIIPPVILWQWLASTVVRPRWSAWGGYVGLALLVCAPWYAGMALREPHFLKEFLWKSHVLRYVQPFIHQQPWWFYLPILIGCTLPWSALWPTVAYFLSNRRSELAQQRTRELGLVVLSLMWWVLFYSISKSKSPPYMAPVLVPLALVIGACVDANLATLDRDSARIWQYARACWPCWTAALLLTAVAICALATAILDWQPWPEALLEAWGAVGLLIGWWRLGRPGNARLAWTACALAALLFNLFAVQDLVAGVAGRNSLAGIARHIRRSAPGTEPVIVSYGRNWSSASFYLRRDGGALLFTPEYLGDLITGMQQLRETFIMVESGPFLDGLLKNLPPVFDTKLVYPNHDGRIALLIVRTRTPPPQHKSFPPCWTAQGFAPMHL